MYLPVNSTMDKSGTRVFLQVPYADRAEVKAFGAKWDKKERLWYFDHGKVSEEQASDLLTYWGGHKPLEELKGEDRTFGGDQLFVDLIPKTCWFQNVRVCVVPTDWDRLRKLVYTRVNNKCECCGASRRVRRLEAHERWEYNPVSRVQKLVRIIALCSACHKVTHIGHTKAMGKRRRGAYKRAVAHLTKVRRLSQDECKRHIRNANELYKDRSKLRWTLDLSLITSNGFKLVGLRANSDEYRKLHTQMEVIYNKFDTLGFHLRAYHTDGLICRFAHPKVHIEFVTSYKSEPMGVPPRADLRKLNAYLIVALDGYRSRRTGVQHKACFRGVMPTAELTRRLMKVIKKVEKYGKTASAPKTKLRRLGF